MELVRPHLLEIPETGESCREWAGYRSERRYESRNKGIHAICQQCCTDSNRKPLFRGVQGGRPCAEMRSIIHAENRLENLYLIDVRMWEVLMREMNCRESRPRHGSLRRMLDSIKSIERAVLTKRPLRRRGSAPSSANLQLPSRGASV